VLQRRVFWRILTQVFWRILTQVFWRILTQVFWKAFSFQGVRWQR
jgi:hypothetical protein